MTHWAGFVLLMLCSCNNAPETMRWLKRDPLGMVDGPNVYAYVRGNVVFMHDPLGLLSWGQWNNSHGARVNVVISPSTIQIWEYDGSTHNQRGSASISSAQHTWYDVHLKISGSNLEVWRGPEGGTLSQILTVRQDGCKWRAFR